MALLQFCMLTWFATGLCVALSGQDLPATCGDQTAQFPGPATKIDSQCGLNGIPNDDADGLQNAAKNNFCPRAKTVSVTSTVMNDLQAKAAPLVPLGSPPESRAGLAGLGEGKLATFEGYVMISRQECAESVNCGASVPNEDAFHDVHISLLDSPKKANTNECTSFVAEMIPHHRPPTWNSCSVNAVAKKGLRVRVTGQLFFDGSHQVCANGKAVGNSPKRSSLWEIHPIYNFEVCASGTCAGGGWQKLEDWSGAVSACQPGACEEKEPSAKKK
jgi:hypothetical protein